jgi:hypothetical protein
VRRWKTSTARPRAPPPSWTHGNGPPWYEEEEVVVVGVVVEVVVVGVVVAIVTCWVCLQRPAATQQLLALALALAPVRNNNHQWLIYKLSSKRYKWKIKYYKGLGTSSRKEALEYFSDLPKHRIPFEIMQNGSLIEMCFSKERISDRKEWIANYEQGILSESRFNSYFSVMDPNVRDNVNKYVKNMQYKYNG